jgi:hypothetical protein
VIGQILLGVIAVLTVIVAVAFGVAAWTLWRD